LGARDRPVSGARRGCPPMAPAAARDRRTSARSWPRRGGGYTSARRAAGGVLRRPVPPPCSQAAHAYGVTGQYAATRRRMARGARALGARGLGARGFGRECVGARAGGSAQRGAARRRTTSRYGVDRLKQFTVPLFERVKLQKFVEKCSKNLILFHSNSLSFGQN
jgi:hypothetical protein